MSGPQSEIPGRTPLGEAQRIAISALDQQHVAHLRLLKGLMTGEVGVDVDQRVLALAVTNAETAHMWAVRSVAKPTF